MSKSPLEDLFDIFDLTLILGDSQVYVVGVFQGEFYEHVWYLTHTGLTNRTRGGNFTGFTGFLSLDGQGTWTIGSQGSTHTIKTTRT